MPARLIKSTDPIEVAHLTVVLYGQPSSRKTSLAQTADRPFTFAFDPGIYRAFGRKDCSTFDSWDDVVRITDDADRFREGKRPPSPWPDEVPAASYHELLEMVSQAHSIVIDTIGFAMESLAQALIRDNAKNGNRMGGLSLPGYGALANQFAQWVSRCRSAKQDVILIAHEERSKVGDEDYFSPAVLGQKFYATLMNIADVVGYLHFESGRRVIEFCPSDRWMAKTPPCGLGQVALPDFAAEPDFLARIIQQAKDSMGKVSAQSAVIVSIVAEWQSWLDRDPPLDEFNAKLPEVANLDGAAKTQVKHVLLSHARAKGWVLEKESKKYVPGGAA